MRVPSENLQTMPPCGRNLASAAGFFVTDRSRSFECRMRGPGCPAHGARRRGRPGHKKGRLR
ncbi:MAG TPA: hypothetical protein DIU49_07820 [Desulfovibrio sp.]|jgi:hypothetical protein|nr:hypothetical protein [Desulfovibrio sp.]